MTKAKTSLITAQGEAETAMLELSDIDSQLADFLFSEAACIALARQKYYKITIARERVRLDVRKKELEKLLKAFATKDANNWPGKSKETPGGTFGFRLSPPAVALVKSIAKTVADAAENIKLDFQKYNRRVDTVNKELIIQDFISNKLDVDRLRECGLKVAAEEKFFVKTNFTEALEKAKETLKTS